MNVQLLDRKLEKLLRATSHKEVVDLMLQYVDNGVYDIIHTPLFTLVTPNPSFFITHKEKVPMICVHTDTVRHSQEPIQLHYNELFNKVHSTNGVLGADDRAGCWIASELMEENFYSSFLICDKEETGGIGSRSASGHNAVVEYVVNNVSAFIGLDRKGNNDCALYGYESSEFMQDVVHKFEDIGYKVANGTFTDASNLAGDFGICCLNLSIGYYNEHTSKEYLLLNEMERCLKTIQYYLPASLYLKQYDCTKDNYSNYYYDNMYDDDADAYWKEWCKDNDYEDFMKDVDDVSPEDVEVDDSYVRDSDYLLYCEIYGLEVNNEDNWNNFLEFLKGNS